MVVSIQYSTAVTSFERDGARDDLQRRILQTVELMDRRGYGVPLDAFASMLYGGRTAPEIVEPAISETPGVAIVNGLVVRTDRAGLAIQMGRRQASHRESSSHAEALASDFTGRLVSSCPLVLGVTLTGSAAAGGFEPADDVDLNLFARDGSKYTVYLWALALSAITSLRHPKKPFNEMGAIPLLRKIICVNVVWEDSQVRPFARQDKWLAYELLVHRTLFGRDYLEAVLAANPWLGGHYPQLTEAGHLAPDDPNVREGARAPRAVRRAFSYLYQHPRALRIVETGSRFAVISLHRLVSLLRTHNPEARDREAFVNMVKRPYTVYDVPGRELPVPDEALRPRDAGAVGAP